MPSQTQLCKASKHRLGIKQQKELKCLNAKQWPVVKPNGGNYVDCAIIVQ
jgi:hypothetical protein